MADGRPGQPDPELLRQLFAMLPPEGRQLMSQILSGNPDTAAEVLSRAAEATGRQPDQLAEWLQQPGATEQLVAELLAGAGEGAAELMELLRQAGLRPGQDR